MGVHKNRYSKSNKGRLQYSISSSQSEALNVYHRTQWSQTIQLTTEKISNRNTQDMANLHPNASAILAMVSNFEFPSYDRDLRIGKLNNRRLKPVVV